MSCFIKSSFPILWAVNYKNNQCTHFPCKWNKNAHLGQQKKYKHAKNEITVLPQIPCAYINRKRIFSMNTDPQFYT